MITVGNLKEYNKKKYRGKKIYVGRANRYLGKHITQSYVKASEKSIFGNPFTLRFNTRDEAIDKYEAYFVDRIKEDEEFRDEFIKLCKIAQKEDVILMCYCAPLRCHADVIKKYMEMTLENWSKGEIKCQG